MNKSHITLDDKAFRVSDVIETLSAQVTPQRLQRISQVINQRSKHFVPVMENIYDRGNVNAVMRSAEAFGFYEFHNIVEIDSFKESKRVTQGADKWLVQKNWVSTVECIQDLKSKGYQIYVTHLEGGEPIGEVSFEEPTALCFGSELRGASDQLTSLCDKKVFVPMQGFVQSFNISVAAALCFQEVRNRFEKSPPPPLSDIERQWLTALYLHRSCKNPKL